MRPGRGPVTGFRVGPERLSAAGIGPDGERFDEALAAVAPVLAEIPVAAARK